MNLRCTRLPHRFVGASRWCTRPLDRSRSCTPTVHPSPTQTWWCTPTVHPSPTQIWWCTPRCTHLLHRSGGAPPRCTRLVDRCPTRASRPDGAESRPLRTLSSPVCGLRPSHQMVLTERDSPTDPVSHKVRASRIAHGHRACTSRSICTTPEATFTCTCVGFRCHSRHTHEALQQRRPQRGLVEDA